MPALTTAYSIPVDDEDEAVAKLKQETGEGVFVKSAGQ
jgi:hypothetical protein